MIEIKNVTKKYGKKVAISNVTFNINDGEIFAFIGHNGAGKTTLIKAMVGIHDFNEGDIIINGTSINDDPIKCKKDMAYVPDNPELYENMKAIDFINFICDMYEVNQEIREKNIKKYAELFEIDKNNYGICPIVDENNALVDFFTIAPAVVDYDSAMMAYEVYSKAYKYYKCIGMKLDNLKVLPEDGKSKMDGYFNTLKK